MSRTSMFLSFLATFATGMFLAACDPMTALAPLPGAVEPLAAAPQGTDHWACAGVQSAEVCNATSTCVWVPGSGECVNRLQLPCKEQ